MTKLVERTYESNGMLDNIKVKVTPEQAKALDRLAERDNFSAYFWAEKVQWMYNGDKTEDGRKVFRVNGLHYVAGSEEPSTMRGCGGAHWKFEYLSDAHEDKIVESTNVWHQGDIPEELTSILVNNAKTIY